MSDKKNINFDDDNYDLPVDNDVFVDVEKDIVKKKTDLNPWEKIKIASERHGVEIRKPRSSCKKCYGRGYIGVDVNTEMPVPCDCIFTKANKEKNKENVMVDNYKNRRRLKLLRKKSSYKKQAIKDNIIEDKKIKADLLKAGTEMALKKKAREDKND